MKVVVDMNLSPLWVGFLTANGIEAVHWTDVGHPRAEDTAILSWARERDFVVFTHDLDFTTLIALSHAEGPSVIQMRTQDVLPEDIGAVVVATLRRVSDELSKGAIVSIDEGSARVRVLPIQGRTS